MHHVLRSLVVGSALVACGTDDPAPQPDLIALPGDAYYPESLSADADGTLYVGSLTTGQVTAYTDGDATPRAVVAAGAGVPGVAGVVVHGDELWICSIDPTFQRDTEARSFGLDGTPREALPLGPGRFCNDLAFDAAGALYVTDSFSGTVLRRAPGEAALAPWLEDAALAPATAGAFGLDGIAIAGDAVIVTKLDTGELYRIAIADDGRAGEVTRLPGTFAGPDGLRAGPDGSLLLVEGAGRLVQLEADGTNVRGLADDLDQPTAVVAARGAAWVTEGQLGRLLAQPPVAPRLPFAVRRIDL